MQVLAKKFEGPRSLKAGEVPAMMRLFDDIFWGGKRGRMLWHLPYLYRDLEKRLETARVVTCQGEIASHVGLYPITFALGRFRVRAGGIGGVLTRPEHRGQGLMAALLEDATEQMRRRDMPLSILWGDRFRYASFGWEPAGTKIELGFSSKSLDYLKSSTLPVVQAQAKDRLEDLERLHAMSPARAVRERGRFLLHAEAKERKLFLSGPRQRPQAYALVSSWKDKEGPGWSLDELSGTGEGMLSLVAFFLRKSLRPGADWMASRRARVHTSLPMAYQAALPQLYAASDAWSSSFGMVGQFKVVDLKSLLSCLGLSSLQRSLETGRLNQASLISVLLGPAGPKVLMPEGNPSKKLSQSLPVPLFLWSTDHV
jgi:predicted N-acetyltransferase YhbS